MKKLLAIILALSLCLCAALACAETVKVGVVGENNEQWEQVIISTLAAEGIEIELVKFSDYIMPNIALAEGEVDLNAFQHYNFMNNWSAENGTELVAVCDTLIAPLCIYSEKYTSLDEVKEGDGIAIMNDVVNEARALRMLEAAGLTNDQALYMEQYDPNNPDMHGIINVIAARADRADEAVFARIAEAYHTDEVRELFNTVYKGVYIPAWQ